MKPRTPDEELLYWLRADANWITLPYPNESKRIHKAADRLEELLGFPQKSLDISGGSE